MLHVVVILSVVVATLLLITGHELIIAVPVVHGSPAFYSCSTP